MKTLREKEKLAREKAVLQKENKDLKSAYLTLWNMGDLCM
jgi:hypothetical protein